MIGPNSHSRWLCLVCDAAGATAYAARGSHSQVQLLAWRRIDFDLDELCRTGDLPPLADFVKEQGLAHAEVSVAFAGAGTLVQRLNMPRMSSRNRDKAVRTRLTNYASGRELVVALEVHPPASAEEAVPVIAAGVELRLSRALQRACERRGLRVSRMTALATAIRPPADAPAVVQIIVGERTTTMQVFAGGRLHSCRDVLVGRRDFVAAYQRPIITDSGPVTLGVEQAEALASEVGVPIGRDNEVRPGLAASKLWPVLNATLQRLKQEVEQTLAHSQTSAGGLAVNVVAQPALPGLGEYLAMELDLQGPLSGAQQSAALFLAAIHDRAGRDPIDLRPPEICFTNRMQRPALAACLVSGLVILANSAAPREAGARASELRGVRGQLESELQRSTKEHDRLKRELEQASGRLQRRARLLKTAPPHLPAIGLFKAVFTSVPADVRLREVTLHGAPGALSLDLKGEYRGDKPASAVAARWARELNGSVFVANAEVKAVDAGGREEKAEIALECALR